MSVGKILPKQEEEITTIYYYLIIISAVSLKPCLSTKKQKLHTVLCVFILCLFFMFFYYYINHVGINVEKPLYNK